MRQSQISQIKNWATLPLLLVLALTFTSCATLSYRPVVYPNTKAKNLGPARTHEIITECMVRAEIHLRNSKNARVNQNMKRGAAAGALIGGVSGLLTGKIENAAAGIIGGAVVGAGGAAIDDAQKDRLHIDPLQARYIQHCLKEQGFDVIGWE